MPYCLVCKKHFISHSFFLDISKINICQKCYHSLPILLKKEIMFGVECFFIYSYVYPIPELLKDLKIKNDIALSTIFLSPFRLILKSKYRGYIILPVPSNKGSDKKRGFNHINEIAKTLNLEICNAFYKKKVYKQSDKRMSERHMINKIIGCDFTKLNNNKKYLIIDDIMTSSNTIKACVECLLNQKFKKIKVLVIANNFKQ